jgi:hypothetical protein
MGWSEAGPGWLSAAWLGRVHPWSWAASSVSAHGAGCGFNPFSIIRSDSNLSQNSNQFEYFSKIHETSSIIPLNS